MKLTDYYAILEVNRHSTDEEIKQNFRRLAKKYHPDANLEVPNAEEIFKELNTAYSTLTDKEKRRQYDRQTLRLGYGVLPNENKDATIIMTELFNTIFGIGKDTKAKVFLKTENIISKIEEMKEPKKGENIEANIEITMDEGFAGIEKKLALKVANNKINNYTVKVPRGIHDGEKIRLAALGKPGKNDGKPGDLIINVKMKSHPLLTIDGSNIYANLFISHTQSVIGDTIYIKVLGEQIEINIPSGSQSRDIIKIPKKGYALGDSDRGDLIVTLNIQPTKDLSERERKIYEQLLKVEKQKLKEKNRFKNIT